ncbi:hypothetical protein A9Q02_22735 [Candidatus Chloroploca asiatica]|uniref:Uncharacterized protein n=1 Tax=Candidatus Chloroploca asiatica TaxID=1506545 RepID=A0A2H3KFP0_9CHLR|nr:hypothetical protein A9Q02_22735 [Candidatus Chloroploca asiatica]
MLARTHEAFYCIGKPFPEQVKPFEGAPLAGAPLLAGAAICAAGCMHMLLKRAYFLYPVSYDVIALPLLAGIMDTAAWALEVRSDARR